jgi:hypothetical protein
MTEGWPRPGPEPDCDQHFQRDAMAAAGCGVANSSSLARATCVTPRRNWSFVSTRSAAFVMALAMSNARSVVQVDKDVLVAPLDADGLTVGHETSTACVVATSLGALVG